MVQGTTSFAGKSTLVTALCRILADDGWAVAPFKAENLSLNSAATPDGGEIGRSQAVQAAAARVFPTVAMNPVLLKPEGGGRVQVVIRGRPRQRASDAGLDALRAERWAAITEALAALRAEHQIVVIEGMGSPAEINLAERDLANMRLARHADAPVLLVGDIDRGGVFASLVGTLALLPPDDRARVRGLVINNLRGDRALLEPGPRLLEERTGLPVVGVIPHLRDLGLPEEDAVGLADGFADDRATGAAIRITVVRLPHLANFDDFDPLRREPGVDLRFVDRPAALAHADCLILPGTKSTLADLHWLRERGLAAVLRERAAAGAPLIGICGGFQMLGRTLADPAHAESDGEAAAGLGLLPVATTFLPEKTTQPVTGTLGAFPGPLAAAAGAAIHGYEIHMGRSDREGGAPFAYLRRGDSGGLVLDGGVSADGRIIGTYVHGLFHNAPVRHALLAWLAARRGLPPPAVAPDPADPFDRLAAAVRASLDMAAIYRWLHLPGPRAGGGA